MTCIVKRGKERTIVQFDGYSEGYGAYVCGALKGTVSIPNKVADANNVEFLATEALTSKEHGASAYYTKLGIKIVKKASLVQ